MIPLGTNSQPVEAATLITGWMIPLGTNSQPALTTGWMIPLGTNSQPVEAATHVIVIKTQISNLVRTSRFWNYLHQVWSRSKIEKTSSLKMWNNINMTCVTSGTGTAGPSWAYEFIHGVCRVSIGHFIVCPSSIYRFWLPLSISVKFSYILFCIFCNILFLCSTPLSDRKYGIKVGGSLRHVIRQLCIFDNCLSKNIVLNIRSKYFVLSFQCFFLFVHVLFLRIF